jgi:hypothetical protein
MSTSTVDTLEEAINTDFKAAYNDMSSLVSFTCSRTLDRQPQDVVEGSRQEQKVLAEGMMVLWVTRGTSPPGTW